MHIPLTLQLQAFSRAQINKITSKRAIRETEPGGFECELDTSSWVPQSPQLLWAFTLALCLNLLAFHQKIQQTKSTSATCRWVRNSSEVSEWRFNSSEYFTTFIKSNHVQEGMLRDVSKKEFHFSLHKGFSAAGCILVSGITAPHNKSGWKGPQEIPSRTSWLKHGHLWDPTTGFDADALWKPPRGETTQLPLGATCSKA